MRKVHNFVKLSILRTIVYQNLDLRKQLNLLLYEFYEFLFSMAEKAKAKCSWTRIKRDYKHFIDILVKHGDAKHKHLSLLSKSH